MAVQKSCWFKSLALSSLGVVVEGRLTGTDSPQTVILKIIEANRGYCLAYSSDTEEEVLDRQGERQGWAIIFAVLMLKWDLREIVEAI